MTIAGALVTGSTAAQAVGARTNAADDATASGEEQTGSPKSYEDIWLNNYEEYYSGGKTILNVDYNWRVQDWISIRGRRATLESLDEHKFLVVQLDVTNDGDEAIEVDPEFFDVQLENDLLYDHFLFDDRDSKFVGQSLAPGESLSDWIAFEIPADVKRAYLVHDPAAYDSDVSALFDQDPSVGITLAKN
jgi:hypothetical protein